jgi:hypothetical protein
MGVNLQMMTGHNFSPKELAILPQILSKWQIMIDNFDEKCSKITWDEGVDMSLINEQDIAIILDRFELKDDGVREWDKYDFTYLDLCTPLGYLCFTRNIVTWYDGTRWTPYFNVYGDDHEKFNSIFNVIAKELGQSQFIAYPDCGNKASLIDDYDDRASLSEVIAIAKQDLGAPRLKHDFDEWDCWFLIYVE